MVGPSSHLQPFHSFQVFSMKSSTSSCSTLSSVKLKKSLIHTLVLSHVSRIARALSKSKSTLLQILKDIQLTQCIVDPLKKNKNKNKNKLFLGSFRLHYNWCSSNVVPVPDEFPMSYSMYYDSTWNSIVSAECDDDVAESQLSGYLHWLEEKVPENSSTNYSNVIDKVADRFIADCHEKFKLEKQESYRRFEEMMARSV